MQVFCNEHGASSSKLLQKPENPKQHEKTDVLGPENHSINLKLFHDSLQYTIVQCSECFEAWPIKYKPKSGANYVCHRCKIDKNIPKKFSAQNNMIPSSLPNELLGLAQIEEMLIARALPIMRVYVKPGGQRGYIGHCINLPQKVSELANSLPRFPSDTPIIIVTMKGKGNYIKDVLVRRHKVERALYWLLKHNPQYKCVIIDSDALESLRTNGIPSNISTIETLEDPDAVDY